MQLTTPLIEANTKKEMNIVMFGHKLRKIFDKSMEVPSNMHDIIMSGRIKIKYEFSENEEECLTKDIIYKELRLDKSLIQLDIKITGKHPPVECCGQVNCLCDDYIDYRPPIIDICVQRRLPPKHFKSFC